MRILHSIGSFLPVRGGGPYFVHHLSRHLERAGHTCAVVTTTAGGEADTETVRTDRARSFEIAGAPLAPGYPVTLERVIRSFDPDLIHSNYPLPIYPEVASVLAAAHDLPHVLTAHGAFEMSWSHPIGVFGQLYNRSLLRGTLRQVDQIHVSNGSIVDEIGFYERYAGKVSVVPIGVDTEWFDPSSVTADPPYDDSGDGSTILYAGAFRRYKGLDTLVAAVDALDRSDVELVLVGDGPEQSELMSLVDSRGLDDVVQFPGFVSDDELRHAYAAADVFVLPSPTITESFGMVALEALAMGLPIVVTDGSGVGRVLDDEQGATVVDSDGDHREIAAAIARLLDEPDRYREQRRHGASLVRERFAWDRLVDEYVEMYERVRSA